MPGSHHRHRGIYGQANRQVNEMEYRMRFNSRVLAKLVSELEQMADEGDGSVEASTIEDMVEARVGLLVQEIRKSSKEAGFSVV